MTAVSHRSRTVVMTAVSRSSRTVVMTAVSHRSRTVVMTAVSHRSRTVVMTAVSHRSRTVVMIAVSHRSRTVVMIAVSHRPILPSHFLSSIRDQKIYRTKIWRLACHPDSCGAPFHCYTNKTGMRFGSLKRVANFTVTRKWKWVFANGCECESPLCAATYMLNSCQDGENASMSCGIELTSNDISVR
jgi:hypothetical protein